MHKLIIFIHLNIKCDPTQAWPKFLSATTISFNTIFLYSPVLITLEIGENFLHLTTHFSNANYLIPDHLGLAFRGKVYLKYSGQGWL